MRGSKLAMTHHARKQSLSYGASKCVRPINQPTTFYVHTQYETTLLNVVFSKTTANTMHIDVVITNSQQLPGFTSTHSLKPALHDAEWHRKRNACSMFARKDSSFCHPDSGLRTANGEKLYTG